MNYLPHHTAISVRNLQNSLDFYESFGFKQVHRWISDDKLLTIIHLKLGTIFLEIFYYAKNDSTSELDLSYANNLEEVGVKHLALQVEDIDEALADLKVKGYADDSTEIREGRTKVTYFFIKDPDGVWVEIVEDKRSY